MKHNERRMIAAVLCSILFHAVLLISAWFTIGPGIASATSDEIYEATNIVIAPSYEPEPSDSEGGEGVSAEMATQIELLLTDKEELLEFHGDTERIATHIREENYKKARKTIPVEKNPAVQPVLVEHSPVPYPSAANGITGTVTVCILVGHDGRPEYVSTAESAGNRFLDAAAVDHCISWRFRPARDAAGHIVRCLVYIPVPVRP